MMAEIINDHIDSSVSPDIPDSILMDWQNIADLVALIAGVRACLIMWLQDTEIEVLVASETINNPYQAGDRDHFINSGLYCEKVIRDGDKLFVANALKSPEWQNNPDMKYNMSCYLGFPIKLYDDRPFGTICILDDKENSYSSYVIMLMEKMRDLIEAHLKLLHLSFNDQLTGLYNRTFFDSRIMEEMKRADRYQVPITMLVLDIDHFKKVNDTYGHAAGDEVLKNIARILTSSLRSADIAVRFGGEEFVVLMPGTSINEAVNGAERIRAKAENNQFQVPGKVTVSIGAAEYIFGEGWDDWFKRADAALYEAKNSGRNKVVAYGQWSSIPAASVHLKWRSEWNSGNEQIDQEHQEIIEMGNHLVNLSLSGTGYDEIIAKLETLLNHIAVHFDHEEKILAEIGYPQYTEHRKIHKKLISKAERLRESYINNKIKPTAFFSFVFDDVIIGHINQEDTKFFSFVRGEHSCSE